MKLKSKGIINLDINGEIYDYKLYQSLNSLAKTGSQRKSAKELNISHTVFNRRLLKAEDKLGVKITRKHRNSTLLTPAGMVNPTLNWPHLYPIKELANPIPPCVVSVNNTCPVSSSTLNANTGKVIDELQGAGLSTLIQAAANEYLDPGQSVFLTVSIYTTLEIT